MNPVISPPTSSADPLPPLRCLARIALRIVADTENPGGSVSTHAVFDHETDHYLLITSGWQGYRRVYRVLAHVAIIGEDVHVYEDGTVMGVAGYLCTAGVLPEHIICSWLREQTQSANG